MTLGRSIRFTAVLAFAGVLSACSTNPTTGRSQLNMMSRNDEIKMGLDAQPELIKEFGGKVPNPDLQNYVTGIGRGMAAMTEADNPSLPWEFTFLNSDVVNAFALPGGKIFLTRGLARRMTNEAQMAGVLGHEIGHVTARHINDKITRQTGLSAVAIGVGIATGSDVAAAGAEQIGAVALLSYDRDQESEADSLGMRYMTRTGYNPIGSLQVMQILDQVTRESGGSPPEMLATHPMPATRIQRVSQEIAQGYANTQNNPKFQTFEDRFRAQFLSKLASIDPAPDAAAVALDMSRPETWCAHCAAAQSQR